MGGFRRKSRKTAPVCQSKREGAAEGVSMAKFIRHLPHTPQARASARRHCRTEADGNMPEPEKQGPGGCSFHHEWQLGSRLVKRTWQPWGGAEGPLEGALLCLYNKKRARSGDGLAKLPQLKNLAFRGALSLYPALFGLTWH